MDTAGYLVLPKANSARTPESTNSTGAIATDEVSQIGLEQACQAQYGSPVRFAFLDRDEAFSGRCFAAGS